jgi:hypothetical protein
MSTQHTHVCVTFHTQTFQTDISHSAHTGISQRNFAARALRKFAREEGKKEEEGGSEGGRDEAKDEEGIEILRF